MTTPSNGARTSEYPSWALNEARCVSASATLLLAVFSAPAALATSSSDASTSFFEMPPFAYSSLRRSEVRRAVSSAARAGAMASLAVVTAAAASARCAATSRASMRASTSPACTTRFFSSAIWAICPPIFDWGVGRAKQRQAELRAQFADMQLTLVRRELDQEFLAAHEGALAAVRRADNARAAVADAQRNADVSIARYRAGEAPIVEVTDALTTLAQQRANFTQALFDYEMARARLQEAAGE